MAQFLYKITETYTLKLWFSDNCCNFTNRYTKPIYKNFLLSQTYSIETQTQNANR